MSIQNIRKQGLIRSLQVNNSFSSPEGIMAQIFKMPSRKECADDTISIIIATMKTPVELSKAPKNQNDNDDSLISFVAPVIYFDSYNNETYQP